jgi:hypothetical protein
VNLEFEIQSRKVERNRPGREGEDESVRDEDVEVEVVNIEMGRMEGVQVGRARQYLEGGHPVISMMRLSRAH